MLPVLAVRRNVYDEILRLQGAGDRMGENTIVFNEKNSHVVAVIRGTVP